MSLHSVLHSKIDHASLTEAPVDNIYVACGGAMDKTNQRHKNCLRGNSTS